MVLKKENLQYLSLTTAEADVVKYIKENPRSCPDDLLYLQFERGDDGFESGFYPGAAIASLNVGGALYAKCNIDDITDITLGDLREFFNI
ncbi:MAG TPA: hypothetical protein VMW32_06800 [Bacteroidales bacterium]|nr:hypothetical protein [Bacteroidales bacterium]